MTTFKKISLTILIAGLVASVAGFGAFSAFSATTKNEGNTFATGTVQIADNDGGGVALYTGTGKKPGDYVESCIRVTYTGSLAASVKLHVSAGITDGTEFNLKVERGTQTPDVYPACGDFAPTSEAYNGTLDTFPTTFAAGRDGKAAGAAWANNDTVVYRFRITQKDDATANAHTDVKTSGSHVFTWEAQNN